MPRPRSITDARLLDAAATVIGRKGPEFTVSDVAAEAGVSVGTVAQRFGSKSGLLQALTRVTTELVVRRMQEASAASPENPVRAALLTWFTDMTDPEVAANHLAQLGVDLIDPQLRALLAEHYAAIENGLADLARAEGLPPNAARVLAALVNGISMDWSVRPRGGLAQRIEDDVDAVLDAWRKC